MPQFPIHFDNSITPIPQNSTLAPHITHKEDNVCLYIIRKITTFLYCFFIPQRRKQPYKAVNCVRTLQSVPNSGRGPRVVVSTAAFQARVRFPVPGLGGLKEKLFLPHPRVKVSIVGSLRDREVGCSASDRQGSNFESCVWRTVSSQSSHHPQEVLLAQFSLYVHKGGLKPDSFHFIWSSFPGLVGLKKKKKMFLPHSLVKTTQYLGSSRVVFCEIQ